MDLVVCSLNVHVAKQLKMSGISQLTLCKGNFLLFIIDNIRVFWFLEDCANLMVGGNQSGNSLRKQQQSYTTRKLVRGLIETF